MYSDPVNKLYLLYLRPVLRNVQRVKEAFQNESADPTKLFSHLATLVQVMNRKVLLPPARVNALTASVTDVSRI